MGQGLWTRPWVRHIAVFVGYGLATVLFRELSVSQWMILAGLRLSVLLLVPYRYWPALIVGESGYFIYQSFTCASSWGLLWAECSAIPGIVFVAPFMYWVRKHWNPIASYSIHMGRLLACALIVSLIGTLHSLSLFPVMHLPAGYVVDYFAFGSDYFIGNYLGVLTVTPLALFAYQMIAGLNWHQLSKKLANSHLLYETGCLVLPVSAFLLWVGVTAPFHAETRQIVQVAMFLPVVWLALRHGCRGAAVGGAAASCVIRILMPEIYDHATTQAEVVVAFAISTMLLMGARIATLDRTVSQERTDFRAALALAQRNVYVGEMQLRMTSQALEQIREAVQTGYSVMMGRLRLLQPAIDDRGYQRQAFIAQDHLQRLADSLYPAALRERGLPNALREGAIARVLREAGLSYACELQGGVSRLSHMIRMTVYRIIWEAITDACLKRDVSEVRVRITGRERNGRRGVAITVFFYRSPTLAACVQWDELLPRMIRATSGLGLQAIEDRAAVFEGRVKTRDFHAGHSMNVFLLDPINPGGD
jgi:two-component system, NarL family, sensor histidine kinase FusK